MGLGLRLATFLSLLEVIGANPLRFHDENLENRRDATPTCQGCWTIGAQCSTFSPIPKLISSMINPPEAAKTTYQATDFCSAFLQTIDYSETIIKSTLGTTVTMSTEMFPWVTTTTVSPSPTLSLYCASPTPGMICGLANGNVLDPVALNEDESEMSPVNSPEDCYQRCLSNPSCKSFFTSQWINSTSWNCDIFRNTLKNNVVSAVPGSNFFDRGCPDLLPSQCNRTDARVPVTTLFYPSPTANAYLQGWDPGSTPIQEILIIPSTVILQVPPPTSTPTSYRSNPMTVAKESTLTLPTQTTQRVIHRAPDDTTVIIGITLQPSDYSSLIPFPTDSVPGTYDPFNPPATTEAPPNLPPSTDIFTATEFSTITEIPSSVDIVFTTQVSTITVIPTAPISIDQPFTIGGGSPKTTITIIPPTVQPPPLGTKTIYTTLRPPPVTAVQPLTTTLYTTLRPTTVNRPTTVLTIYSTLPNPPVTQPPSECVNRGIPPPDDKRATPLTSFNHRGRDIAYTAIIPDCSSVPNNNNNPNHYTSVINPSTVRGPQATSSHFTYGSVVPPRPLTTFNHVARAVTGRGVDGFVPNYSTILPDYLKNWYVDYYGAIIPQACSCLITSPAAETTIHATTTQYFSVYYVDILYLQRYPTPAATEFVTPYLTTAYLTVA